MKIIFEDKIGKIIISLILGLGLSSLFRKVCVNECIVLKGPNPNEIQNNTYRYDKKCFKYTPFATKCNS